MGWTFTTAKHYKPNGTVDRKAEVDEMYTCYNAERQIRHRVLKSTMVGAVYYGAIELTKPDKRVVLGVVVLTSSDSLHGCNFGYKDMDETEGPVESKCPNSILNLLTPTTSEFALDWRARCRAYNEAKKSPTALSKLPIGSKITFRRGDTETLLVKHPPAYQFKAPFWYEPATNRYCMLKYIPKDYKVVYIPETRQGVTAR